MRAGGYPSAKRNPWTYPPATPPDGLAASNILARYQFDGTADNLVDRTGNGNDLTVIGTVNTPGVVLASNLKGHLCKGASFQRAVPSAAIRALTGDMTVEWMGNINDCTSQYLFGLGGNGGLEADNILGELFFDASSLLSWTQETGAASSTTKNWGWGIPSGTISHIIVSRKASDKKLYLWYEGMAGPVTAAYPANPTGGSTAVLNIGADEAGASKFVGVHIGFRLYDAVFTDAMALSAFLQCKRLR
jgi:hypothetical protein